jgi:hypothetical protein
MCRRTITERDIAEKQIGGVADQPRLLSVQGRTVQNPLVTSFSKGIKPITGFREIQGGAKQVCHFAAGQCGRE